MITVGALRRWRKNPYFKTTNDIDKQLVMNPVVDDGSNKIIYVDVSRECLKTFGDYMTIGGFTNVEIVSPSDISSNIIIKFTL